MTADSKQSPPTSVLHDDQIQSRLPVRMTSTVVKGYGRGSTELGIPTANLECTSGNFAIPIEDMPCGIYWGFCRINNDQVYKTAVSIGYNPTYGNEKKTVEPHLIAPSEDSRRHASSCGETVLRDFYDEPIRLSVVGYLRPELPFEGIEKLVVAIKNDIVNAEKLAESTDEAVMTEKQWVASDEPVKSL